MTVLGPQYPLAKSPGQCASSGKPFSPGESIVASLTEKPGGGLERRDYSADAWTQLQNAGAPRPPGVLGFWRTIFTPGDKKNAGLLGDTELLDLFDDLANVTEPAQLAFRYFLALLLIRRRMLRVIGQKDGALLVLRRGEQGEPRAIHDPGLSEGVVADAIEQLGQVVAPEGVA